MALERDQFEEVAMAHFVAQRAAGVQISGDNGCEPTRESLFWHDDKGDYGVRMFNAAWWGWKEAAVSTRKTCEVPPMDEAAMARLAEIERQEPVAEMTLVDMGIGDARQLRVNWLTDVYLDVGAKLYASAGASTVESSQAQPPAPSDTAITYMTGYSDGREWAGATNQAQPEQPALSGCACRWDADDKRVATCVRHRGWLDVVSEWAERAKAAESQQAQQERAPLRDAELEQEFCNITGLETGINPAAADTKRALVWFKKGYAHAIKQGGQHEKDQ